MIPNQQLELDFNGLKLIRCGRYPNFKDRPDWQIEGLWAHAGVGMVTAQEKAGKTWLMLTIALCIASGTPFLGRFPVRQGPVIVYTPEGDRKDLQDRIDQLSRRMGIELAGLDFFTAEMNGLCIDSPAHQETIMNAIQGVGASLVIFDPLRDCMEGQLSNNDDATVVTKFCLQIQQEHNCGVMISHHENSDGKMMGAKAWSAFADSLWHLRVADGDQTILSNIQRKEKTVEDLQIARVKMDDDIGLEIVGNSQPSKTLDDHILDLLTKLPKGSSMTVTNIRENLRRNNISAPNEKVSTSVGRLKFHKEIVLTPPYGYRLATPEDFAQKSGEKPSVREGVPENQTDGTGVNVKNEGKNSSRPSKSQWPGDGRTGFEGQNGPEPVQATPPATTGLPDLQKAHEGADYIYGNNSQNTPPCKGGWGDYSENALKNRLYEAGFDHTDIEGMSE
ncbi:MAG: AAA family ATPase [Candidatus Nitronauta litoralis]|uniref:AAA family ATPase n=1 Tax=Candidatus Nitronauta litoralis TaxID=2705533 RepID=A0A7T0FZT8_9BACT|nr:MAG: AAA family ATPase [Candidatus Nitronauta litoralis]